VYKTPNIRRRLIIILAATLAFMAALGGFLFWYLGGQEEAATREANKFITAVEKNDASIAPRNGDDYVRGIWHAYRRVDDVELIKTRQKTRRSGSASRGGSSYWVADMLLHTGRGLAVLELSFEANHLNPKTQIIDSLYELTPDRIPGGALDDQTLARVKSDLRERGEPENIITLQQSEAPAPSRTRKPPGAAPKPPKPKQSPVIRCIRRAHGDVTKIQKCAKLAPS
jgi:hypothetical protein